MEQIVLPSSSHERQPLCTTRLPYRDGRELKAVKVYTVCEESVYLAVHHIPALDLHLELKALFTKIGEIETSRVLKEYPSEKFAEAHLFKYKKSVCARLAKRKMDNFNFHGSVLHVHYLPELESVEETRRKLEDRRHQVSRRISVNRMDLQVESDEKTSDVLSSTARKIDRRKPDNCEVEVTEKIAKPLYGPRFNPYQK